MFPDDKELQLELANNLDEFNMRKDYINNLLDNEPEIVKSVSDFFANTDIINDLKNASKFTLVNLTENKILTIEALESYYKFAKFKYECGLYDESELMLCNFLSITQPPSAIKLGALWGRLVCRILGGKKEQALIDFREVKDAIEVRNIAPMDQLRQRAWLLHWGLFVYINQPNGIDELVDFFWERPYLQVLENLCPWLLRYYTAFVIMSPLKRRNMLRETLIPEIQSMAYMYSDPITEFISSLFEHFDFDEAQLKLTECQKLIENDFFLQIFAKQFMHEARMLIIEMYCTINRRIDLVMLAEKLQLTDEEAEKWMVDMVRGQSTGPIVDAKIDSSKRQVIMASPSRSAHQQVMEKTRELTVRSGILTANLGSIVKEQSHFLNLKKKAIRH